MFDVVIAGAGPNGLMLACELALAGIRPLVLEKLTGPTTEQRANGLVGQVVRMLDRRGLYERLTGTPDPPVPVPRFMFGAFPLPLHDLPDNPLYTLMVPQSRIEAMLAERAAELGVEVRRGHEVLGVTQNGTSVTIEVAGRAPIEASYLVGADGGRSRVRGFAGIGFPGVTTDDTVSRTGHVSVPADLVDPHGALHVPGFGVLPPFQHTRTERGLITWAPFPGGRPALVSVAERAEAGDAEMTVGELRAAAARVLGADLPIAAPTGAGPHLLRRTAGGNTRLADRYRAGRVLLVGDAAHVHSAIGGPGLNLGLQDAINLGWKLAAEVRGHAPDGLLDTYESERRPVGERVNMHTRAQSVLVGPGGEITALRQLFGELLESPQTRRHIAALMAGADITYDMGTATGPHVGRWAPDVPGLAALTRTGRPLLLDPTGRLDAGSWADRVDVARTEGTGTALLLRPDCYVAWEGTSADGLEEALSRWFGKP
ncbi:FAD-dependent monooxygenase [Amorphoplanes digitatis]|uniref:2-polyprenyl-6-methoxyphenol hydroxylase-like FAD-dependent oxidoreductase n=1 Tax=Actinoplanes digitatis TaxID=1868 RepID=A0A7W7HXX1_9ACTN|nr:FAD-dependent monooxygenase [Actinoplanes digitatis]MBB4762805.1 2-polyprenyl-6-methoxyphenol hydroxylase-like FAD-dependent oxidoreductase [Actinoplanes digitatis]GID91699.1 FAD-dependent oxidoreductase [Actinoplanes digitatis]